MGPLPPRLVDRLNAQQRGVVAPVLPGVTRGALRAWAAARGWPDLPAPPPEDARGWLWCPATLTDLRALPAGHAAEALVLSPADVRFSPDDWAAALPHLPPATRSDLLRALGGWPDDLAALQASPADPAADPSAVLAALRHAPATRAVLAPAWPPEALEATARRLAASPLLTPGVVAALGVDPASVQALLDGGWLLPDGLDHPGPEPVWQLPGLLRRVLNPLPELAAAQAAAHALELAGHDAAALEALEQAGAWEDALRLLARTARVAQGEAALRAALQSVPRALRATPPAQYLAGLLARSARDPDGALELYNAALTGLDASPSDPLRGVVANARGVVRAMRGDAPGALADFELAAQGSSLTAGEAHHNRAQLLIQTGRHAEAEQSLRRATTVFRALGDAEREARSLGALGGLQFGRGLLREATGPYAQAAALLADRPREAALARLNLAEVHAMLGDEASAETLLGTVTDQDALDGWVRRLRALLALNAGRTEGALDLLSGPRSEDPSLLAETALLRARAHRELGDAEAAAGALAEAGSLGLRADLEAALQGAQELDGVIEAARQEEARLELATALLARGGEADLQEALTLIRAHGLRTLLHARAATALLAGTPGAPTRELFPLRVQTVGPLQVQHAGRTYGLADFPTRKSAALLLTLALAGGPQPREALAERFWPDAKNPLASLQTALYHLRALFGTPLISSERGVLTLLFPVESDLADLRDALGRQDRARLERLLHPLTAPLLVLPELPHELAEERAQVERVLHDALRSHAEAQAGADPRRRDALRLLITADPLDLDSREKLVQWHEARGELDAARQERRHLEDARRALHGT